MLRGSRHDGIPNNQSARERDRQRERQRQERAQMLPNDDKDATANSQDLFHPPRQVKPSVEDPTSLEIRKSLGNFESVRPYMLDNSNRTLIGVHQHTAGTAPSAPSGSNNISSDKQRLPINPGGLGSSSTSTGSTIVAKPSSTLPAHRNFNPGPGSSGVPSLPSNTSHNIFRPSVQKVPLIPSQPLLPQPQPLLAPPVVPHYNQVINNSTYLHSANNSGSSNLTVPHANPLRHLNNSTTTYPYTHTNHSSASSVEVPPPEGLRSKVDRCSNNSSPAVSADKSVRASVPSAGVPHDKNFTVTNNKPPLQRADSQIELESMLREMMDVKTPLTAIQTPVKETAPKRFSQRRSSKEENIVQNTADNAAGSMASSPKSSKLDSSDSSSNGDSSSESDSEDSSSGSQAGGDTADSMKHMSNTLNSPTRNWDLLSLMDNLKKDNIIMKPVPDSSALSKVSPKPDSKLRKNLSNSSDDQSPVTPPKVDPSVSSTSLFGKVPPLSPLEPSIVAQPNLPKVPNKSPRRTPVRNLVSVPDPHTPTKLPPPPISSVKGASTTIVIPASSQGPSLSGSSSEDESEKPKDPPPRIPVPEPKPPPAPVVNTSAGRKRRKPSSSSSDRNGHKSDDDSSPETKPKSKKIVQDRNKHDMIGKLFRGRKKEKVESPSIKEKVKATGTRSSTSSVKQTASNRVSAKDSGRKSANATSVTTIIPPTSLVQNGLETSSSSKVSSAATKKRESTAMAPGKNKSPAAPQPPGKRQKPNAKVTPNVTGVTTLPPPASSVVRVKDETTAKLNPASLICRIPLNKLHRKIPITPASTNIVKPVIKPPPSPVKPPPPAKGGKGGKAGRVPSREDSNSRVRLHYDSSRVGSSSDQSNDTHVPLPRKAPLVEESIRLDSGKPSANNHSTYKKERRKSRSSQKKTKVKPEPNSHSKVKDDSASTCEVSSNVVGYNSSKYYPPLEITARTPPVEMDIAQAPDSSLNPPHLPSPVVQPLIQFYSYFDKIDHNDDDYFSRGQEAYLEEAKRLKHKADREDSGPQAQASTYLEAGLYFILAGNTIERERSMWSREAFTMYKDTLNLIRFIGSRFRARQDNINEAKITILSLRCQSLLALKLFKMRMKETKDGAQYLNEHFQKTPPLDIAPMANSPQLSTPSPRSPTLSPAGPSGILVGLTPSPHHPQQNHQVTTVTVSRTLYSQMFKHCTNTINLISAHEMWDAADSLIEKYHLQEFFKSIDRIFGPLTLHTTLMDLVRYVRHGLGVLKNCSDSS